jgi:hypothetical protein
MDNKSDILVQLIDSYVVSLTKRLKTVLKDSCSTGKIGIETWRNPQIIFGCVSFNPQRNPEEENIDATFIVNLGEDKVKVTADICWSDGDMISDFGEYEIVPSSFQELSEKIKKIYSQIDEKMFQKMAELIRSDLPSKYRRD